MSYPPLLPLITAELVHSLGRLFLVLLLGADCMLRKNIITQEHQVEPVFKHIKKMRNESTALALQRVRSFAWLINFVNCFLYCCTLTY